jgi:RNA ligase
MKIDLKKLQEEIDGGWVFEQKHPDLPLRILKYSKKTTYDNHWNEITNICRGLVIDNEGNIVINCIPKFHNSFDKFGQETLKKNEGKKYEITEKWDGQLVQIALWNDNVIITSSGSFCSDVVDKVREILDKEICGYSFLEYGKSYVFELIHNKIIVDYDGLTKLVLLTIRETETSEEKFISSDYLIDWHIDGVEPISKTLEEIIKDQKREDYINKEGYVVKFENGDRVKVKYLKYLEIHKLASGLNETFVWETLKNGNESILQNVPDEMIEWTNKTVNNLKKDYNDFHEKINNIYLSIPRTETKKEFAKYVFENHKNINGLLFSLYDKKDFSKLIWDRVKPS